jgi:uncharacterized membrane protein
MAKGKQKRTDIQRRPSISQTNSEAPPLPIGTFLTIIVLVAVAMVAFWLMSPGQDNGNDGNGGPGPNDVGAVVRIPLVEIGPDAKYFSYPIGGIDIRFFAFMGDDGNVHAALDACSVCYEAKRGFHQENETMQCNSCGKYFDMSGIGAVSGDCWPSPVATKIEGDEVLLPVALLQEGAYMFA